MPETALSVYKDRTELAEASTFSVMAMAFELATKLAQTEFVPATLRNKPAAVAAAILQGHEVGIPPMASLQHIHVIEGRPSMSAAIMRALILSRGHEIWIEEQTITRATVCGRRQGDDRVTQVTWTMDDAKRASLAGKQNWQRYPRNMLVARATGDVARGAFMDILGGLAYASEELEDGVLEGEVLEGPVSANGTPPADTTGPAATTRRRRAGRAATAAAEPSEPPPAPEPETGEQEPAEPAAQEGPAGPDPSIEPAPDAGVEQARNEDPQPTAGEAAPGEGPLTLAQQVAMLCRQLGIERKHLILAVTGKESGREITRQQAVDVVEAAKAIERGEKRLVEFADTWVIGDVVQDEPTREEVGQWD